MQITRHDTQSARQALHNWQARTASYSKEELALLREAAAVLSDEIARMPLQRYQALQHLLYPQPLQAAA